MVLAEVEAGGAQVALLGIRKGFGRTPVLRGVSLAVAPGEFVALLGPSGCGKSTLLRILAGLESADEGEVWIGGARADALPPKRRDLAMVFQSYALYPHMTVARNISLPLEMRRLSAVQRLPLLGPLLSRAGRRGIAAEVEAVAGPLGLAPLLGRRPAQLSGGQRQRVALARAMVRHPAAFLMDEPLSNLDARLRAEARSEIVSLVRRLGVATIYVTHDQAEAMAMADRVAVMEDGRILQCDVPRALYDEPASLAVARFVGSPPMNALAAEVSAGGRVALAGGLALGFVAPGFVAPGIVAPGFVPQGFVAEGAAGGVVTLGVRPEALRPDPRGLPFAVARIEHLGAEALVHGALAGQPCIARLAPEEAASLGDAPRLAPTRALLFGADGQRLPLRTVEPAHG